MLVKPFKSDNKQKEGGWVLLYSQIGFGAESNMKQQSPHISVYKTPRKKLKQSTMI